MNGGPEGGEHEEMQQDELRLTPFASGEVTREPDAEEAAFEAELRRALRPVDLPAGFADRVLARAAAEKPGKAKVLAFPGWRVALSGAAAAALVVGSLVGFDVHQNHERERARAAATQQFETATRITDAALEHTREQLERAGVFGQ